MAKKALPKQGQGFGARLGRVCLDCGVRTGRYARWTRVEIGAARGEGKAFICRGGRFWGRLDGAPNELRALSDLCAACWARQLMPRI